MARIVLMSTMEKGHVNPVVGVAQWLRRMGHTVGWLCIPHPEEQVLKLDVEVLPFNPPPPPELPTRGEEIAALVRDNERLRPWLKTLLLDAVPAQIEPVRQSLRNWRPDLVALDPMLYQGVIAARAEGIPLATISSSLNPATPASLDTPHTRNVHSIEAERSALFAQHGIEDEFRLCDWRAPRVNVVFATREYLGELADVPPNVQLVGPSLPPGPRGDEPEFDWSRLDGRPLLYASFGSQIFHQPELFGKLARASAGLGVQLLLSAGPLAESAWARELPPHVLAVKYVPQLQVLERARAFVTHGGANSIMEALYHGVPLLQSPVCNDQFLQAEFLRRSGAGVVLDLYSAGEAQVRETLAGLLRDDAPQRGAITPIQASYRAHDGARKTAELLHALVT